MKSIILLFIIPLFLSPQSPTGSDVPQTDISTLRWRQVIFDQPEAWYGSDEAIAVADNVLLYQRNTGGWPKNIAMHKPLDEKGKADLLAAKDKQNDSTIDNDATTQEMIYLVKVFGKTNIEAYRDAFLKGLRYLLEAQYDNGGWPQYYPLVEGYYTHITYNDDAIVNVMTLLREAADRKDIYAFVSEADAQKCADAFDKGIDCILKTQYRQNGELTVWCGQHDEYTLAPAKARAYELPSLSGSESVGIVDLLMSLKNPSPEVKTAIAAAIKWFDKVKIEGIKIEPFVNDEGKRDRRVVQDPAAGPIWARFYTLEDNRPFFCDRDGIKKYSLAEIGYERRTGYSWYTNQPAKFLTSDGVK